MKIYYNYLSLNYTKIFAHFIAQIAIRSDVLTNMQSDYLNTTVPAFR